MPIIYLSPSTQETRHYAGGGNEEYYMNLIVDELVPYLNSAGINYVRSNHNKPVSSSINQSNLGNYDLHLAIHSGEEESDEKMQGQKRGANVYYTPGDPESFRASQIIHNHFKEIYPISEQVKNIPNNLFVELKDTNAPAVLLEVAQHDNYEDANWIRENVENIAENIAMSLTEFFSIPLITPQQPHIIFTSEKLDLYSRPSTTSPIISVIPSGANLLKLGEWENWSTVDYLGNIGYVKLPIQSE